MILKKENVEWEVWWIYPSRYFWRSVGLIFEENGFSTQRLAVLSDEDSGRKKETGSIQRVSTSKNLMIGTQMYVTQPIVKATK